MGMYDRVEHECKCPICDNKVNKFQSKDGKCRMEVLNPNEVSNFYAECEKCGAWLEFTAKGIMSFELIVTGESDYNEVLHAEDVFILADCYLQIKQR